MDSKKIVGEIIKNAKLLCNVPSDELRSWAKDEETTSAIGNPRYITKIQSRSAKFTEIIYDKKLNKEQIKIIEAVKEYLKGKELICSERTMCQNPDFKVNCKLLITKKYSRLPFMWQETLFPLEGDKVDIVIVGVPEWPERKVLVDAESFVTFMLGTDYTGEVKKGFLRMGMYKAKKKRYLGLHAGSKIIKVKDREGNLVKKGVIMFGLSGTGKTTLSCHDHDLKKPEGVVIRQDDINMFTKEGYCVGTENNFYIKTEGLEPKNQAALYKATVSKNALYENIYVDENGKVDLLNYSITSNGRALVYRKEILNTDDKIDLPHTDIAIFITRRNDVVPAIAKLTPEQGAAFFMLGESIETTAGDPSKAGQSIRVVGTNPFIVGPEDEEGNIFYGILKKNHKIQCFLMNTGYVGDKEKITINDSVTIIKEIARDTIKWKKDEEWDYYIAEEVPGIDMKRLDPKGYYSKEKYKELNEKLREERVEWLEKFKNLDKKIKDSI